MKDRSPLPIAVASGVPPRLRQYSNKRQIGRSEGLFRYGWETCHSSLDVLFDLDAQPTNVQFGIPALQRVKSPTNGAKTLITRQLPVKQLHPKTQAAIPEARPHRHHM